MRYIYLIIGACYLLPASLQAAEWSLTGNVFQTLGYDDNLRLRSGNDRRGTVEYKIIPTLTFLHKTDVSEIQADASYGTQVYSNPAFASYNQDIQNYGVTGLYKTKRIDWGLGFTYAITPTRNSAQLSSGDFITPSFSNRWQVAPTMTYKLSEIDSLTLAPSYSESSFSQTGASNFRNYNTKDINFTWQRLWTERYSSSVSLFYSNFLSQSALGGNFKYDSFGINFSNAYSWSENWKLNGTVGIRDTESNSNSIKSSSIGFLANASVTYTGESLSGGLNFSRSLAPSNQGYLQEQTTVGLDANYKITDNLSATFNTGYVLSTRVNSGQGGQLTRENIIVNPSLNWKFSPEWVLTGSYRYRSQDRSGANNNPIDSNITSGYSNLFMLSINYNWQGLKLSR